MRAKLPAMVPTLIPAFTPPESLDEVEFDNSVEDATDCPPNMLAIAIDGADLGVKEIRSSGPQTTFNGVAIPVKELVIEIVLEPETTA